MTNWEEGERERGERERRKSRNPFPYFSLFCLVLLLEKVSIKKREKRIWR